MMSAMTRTARRMFELLEPICLVTYFADECNEELAALGHRIYWDGYFASRAAGASVRRILGDELSDSPGLVRATDLSTKAATSAPISASTRRSRPGASITCRRSGWPRSWTACASAGSSTPTAGSPTPAARPSNASKP
jgi:hypothetical protein